MDDNIRNLRDALEWLFRDIVREAEMSGKMTNENAIRIGFIRNMLDRFPECNYQGCIVCKFNNGKSYTYKKPMPDAKQIEPQDGTVVWVVYRNGGDLVIRKEDTWCGTVPFECGPRETGIVLLEDHSVRCDIDENYIQPVAWFYTKEEAEDYVKKHSPLSPPFC